MKKGKLSLAKGKKKVLPPSERFNTTVTTNEIEQQSKGFVPKNTARSTDWAYRTFKYQYSLSIFVHLEVWPLEIRKKPLMIF